MNWCQLKFCSSSRAVFCSIVELRSVSTKQLLAVRDLYLL